MKSNKFCLFFAFAFALVIFVSSALGSNASAMARTNGSAFDDCTAKAMFLMDFESKTPLFEKNADAKMPVASIVKLMTIEIALQEIEAGNLDVNQKIVASHHAASMGGSQVFIEEGAEYSVGDLLKSAIVASANDACVALAEQICGSEESFVDLMNKKAKEFGLNSTHYANATGLPAPNQFSSARDTATLLTHVAGHELYHTFSTIWMDTIKHPKGRESEIVNTNKLVRYFEGCDGGKTGSTSEAGYCLCATAKRGDMRLVAVVLGAENGKARFAETSKLLNFGFANFEQKTIVCASKHNTTVDVCGSKITQIEAVAEKDFCVVTKKRENDALFETTTKILPKICAPVEKGDKVGEIVVTKNGEVVAIINLVANQDAQPATFFDNITKVVDGYKIA